MSSRPIPIEKMVSSFKSYHKTSHLFKIDNFSLLKKNMVSKVESSIFDLGGHKWKLIVSPFVDRYVHIFLENQAPINVNVQFEVFVLNQRRRIWKTSGKLPFGTSSINKTMGTEKLMLYEDLNEKTGYLIEDCCMFGVKLYGIVPAKPGTAECFNLIKKPQDYKVTWKIRKFSFLDSKRGHQSKEFVLGNRKWGIEVHSNGDSSAKNKSLSVFLVAKAFVDDNAPKTRTFVKCELRVYDQFKEDHHKKTLSEWVSEEPDVHLGFSDFMPLEKLKEPYLVKNQMYVGVEFELITVTNHC